MRPARRARAWLRWMRRAYPWAGGALLALLLLAGGLFLFLTRVQTGQRVVLEEVLRRLQGAVNGRIVVDDVRSGRLLEGATLYGVRIDGPDGRPFFQADSLTLAYDWRTFLGGDVILDRLTVWRPHLFLSRYPGEDRFNADRIFRTDEEADTLGAGPRVLFRDVALEGGLVRIVFPVDPQAEPTPRVVTFPDPGGSDVLLRRMVFEDIQARLPEVVVASPDVPGPIVRVGSLALVGQVYSDPFRLTGMEGLVRWAENRLTVVAERVETPRGRAAGTVTADFPPGEEGYVLSLELTTPGLALGDLRWLEPRLPEGTVTGGIGLRLTEDEQSWTFAGAELETDGSRVRADGALRVRPGESLRAEELSLDVAPLALALLEPFLDQPLPVAGTLEGEVTLDGPPEAMEARGRLTLRRPGSPRTPTTARFGGTFLLDGSGGVRGLEATLDPLDFGVVAELLPDFRLAGPGSVTVSASGTLRDGLRFEGRLAHRPLDAPASSVMARGSLRQAGDELVVDVQADVSPLSFTALRAAWPELPLTSEVTGSLRATGRLSNLRLTTDLDTDAGALVLDIRMDARDPTSFYEVVGTVTDFALSRLVPELPEPTVLSGEVAVTGRGVELASAEAGGRFRLREARIGDLDVDTAALSVRVSGGILHLDTVQAVAGGVELEASGALPVEPGGPPGRIQVAFASDSLGRLAPLLGDSLPRAGDLTPLEVELLALDGVEVEGGGGDRLEGGRVRGEVVLTGSLEDFTAEGAAAFEDVVWGTHHARTADVRFRGTALPDLTRGVFEVAVEADSVGLFGRAFQGLDVEVDYAEPRGRVELILERSAAEDYRLGGAFEVDSTGGRVELERLALRFDSLTWQLADTAAVRWGGDGLQVTAFALVRPGGEGARIEIDGLVPTAGPADFSVRVENLELGRVVDVLQMEEREVEGVVDLSLRVGGTAAEPVITGGLTAERVRYQNLEVTRVDGDLDYRERTVYVDLAAWREELRVLTVQGTVPANLALQEVAQRFGDQQMDLAVVADSLPASLPLAFTDALEAVEGTLAGEFRIRGTVENPAPSGTLVLSGAGWTLAELGVRHRDIRGTLTLRDDGSVEVDAVGRAEGTIRTTGTVRLEPLMNPTFDLRIALDGFRGVDRRDVEGLLSGAVQLTGTFQRPFLSGALQVDQGTLFLEEFQRSAEVVDLSDPAIFRVIEETELPGARPILEESQNPFMQNLRMNVDLLVQRNTWLRSADMDVEIGGDLIVTYDRAANDLVLVGELQAIRGSYTVLGRRFEVDEGVVEFVGTPGLNPNLTIQASTRIRRSEDTPLEVLATVGGTLENPRVALSTEEGAVAESDLVSFLVFGRPSYQLASGQESLLAGARGSLLGAVTTGGLSLLSGTVASRLSALAPREWGLDYFAITQPGDLGFNSAIVSSLRQTRFEIGRYLSEDFFLVLVLQPLTFQAATAFGGVRLEWQVTDLYTAEAFYEERFLRNPAFGFQETAFRAEKVMGIFVFSEWGY